MTERERFEYQENRMRVMKYILVSLESKTKVFSEKTKLRHIRDWAVINNYLLRDVQLIEINDIKKENKGDTK